MSDNFDDENNSDFVIVKKETPKKKSGSGTLFLIIVAVIILLAAAYKIKNPVSEAAVQTITRTAEHSPKLQNLNKIMRGLKSGDSTFTNSYIAAVHINGVIQDANKTYNQKWLLDTIEKLADDPMNKGILLVIDSPGGTVYEADEAYLALTKYKSTGKPVWAYLESLAASGGYYIACAADEIYANRNTLTGSIGVIFGTSFDATELLSKMGIKSRTFTAGRNKNMLNYNQPLTEEQEKIMQSIADECYEQFTGIVAASRMIPITKLRSEIADGRIYTAKQAMDLQLVDLVCSYDEAKNKMTGKVRGDDEYVSVEDFSYVFSENIFDRLSNIITNLKSPVSLSGLRELDVDASIKGPAYLYR